MAIKKSELYSSLWASCDELRGGMDASQYKDYILFRLFIKYVSDKYGDSDDFAPPVNIPKGASFKDMVALKGKPDIGNKINTHVIPWPEFRIHLKKVPRQHQFERVKASHLHLAKHEGSVTARGNPEP